MSKTILVVDDESRIRLIVGRLLESRGYHVLKAEDGKQALEFIPQQPDLVILDYKMPGMDGMETLRRIKELDFSGKIIFLTAFGSIPNAVAAMQEGAYDYITKPFVNEEFLITVERALKVNDLEEELVQARKQLKEKYSIQGIITGNRQMMNLIDMLERVSAGDTNVVISGESGTGKELFAKAIHQQSNRSHKPFVALNCSALPDSLLESELFGYKKGAFSGADRNKPGLVQQAHNGTLFLDEIGEMGAEAQAKVLRFTQSGEFIILGDNKPSHVDVRIIAATNRDLGAEVDAGNFRADLFYRLNVVEMQIPPLRERAEDVPLLVKHFIKKHGEKQKRGGFTFSAAAFDCLLAHSWPGNVRELENIVKGALVLALENPMDINSLPEKFRKSSNTNTGFAQTSSVQEQILLKQEEIEKEAILKALDNNNQNRTHAAEELGISRNTLIRKIKKYGI